MEKVLNWNQKTGLRLQFCFLNVSTLQRPALPRFLKLLIPGKLARGPGANPQTKSETSAGLERLLPGSKVLDVRAPTSTSNPSTTHMGKPKPSEEK